MEILGITLGRSMGFNNHIKNVCRKADQKLFNYCPLVWISVQNNLINRAHERGLRLTYTNETNKECQQIVRGKKWNYNSSKKFASPHDWSV